MDKQQQETIAERRQAWIRAKCAVRAYARDPSNANAADVRAAWEAIRRLDAVTAWRKSHRNKRGKP